MITATQTQTEEEDEEGREQIEKLRYLTSSVCECISSLVQHASTTAFLPLGGEEGSSIVQRLSLVLCRCAAAADTDTDISLHCIGTMGFLGVKNDLVSATGSTGFLKPKINWLLSNSILRVLESLQGNKSDPQQNIYLFEMCLGAFIDLHSSDDVDILQNFIKLKSIEKLKAGLHIFEEIVREVSEDYKSKRESTKGKTVVAGDGDGDSNMEEVLTDFEETVLNSHSFIEYKANYCK